MKKKQSILLRMITANDGGISSKIIIGAVCFVALVIATIILMFCHPEFPGLADIIITELITAASLLGLTTIDNMKDVVDMNKSEKEKFSAGFEYFHEFWVKVENNTSQTPQNGVQRKLSFSLKPKKT